MSIYVYGTQLIRTEMTYSKEKVCIPETEMVFMLDALTGNELRYMCILYMSNKTEYILNDLEMAEVMNVTVQTVGNCRRGLIKKKFLRVDRKGGEVHLYIGYITVGKFNKKHKIWEENKRKKRGMSSEELSKETLL